MVAVAAQQTEHRSAKPRESWEHAIWRLAEEAERHGVLIYQHTSAQGCTRYYATSQSHAGELHYVTLTSCDCQGFARHQRCRHVAALLQHTGNLPPRLEGFVHRVRCRRCWGDGMIGEMDKWCELCPECHGSGTVEVA